MAAHNIIIMYANYTLERVLCVCVCLHAMATSATFDIFRIESNLNETNQPFIRIGCSECSIANGSSFETRSKT